MTDSALQYFCHTAIFLKNVFHQNFPFSQAITCMSFIAKEERNQSCMKKTSKTPSQHYWLCDGVHMSYNRQPSSVANTSWLPTIHNYAYPTGFCALPPQTPYRFLFHSLQYRRALLIRAKFLNCVRHGCNLIEDHSQRGCAVLYITYENIYTKAVSQNTKSQSPMTSID